MPQPSPEEAIKRRLDNQTPFDLWRRKVHGLRKTVAGDHSQFGRPAQRYDPLDSESSTSFDDKMIWSAQPTTGDLYDVLVMDYESGRGNELLVAARTLLYTVSFGQPRVTFDNLDEVSAAFHAAYLARRLRECNAHHHYQLALLDAIVGGMGWVLCNFERGVPGLRHADSIDVTWDLSPRLSQDIRWASVRVRQPLWWWINEFGRKAVLNATGAQRMSDYSSEDALVTMEYYYSTEGGKGRHAIWPRSRGLLTPKPIHSGENPFRYDLDGHEIPFLPLRPCTILNMPSVRFPVGLIESMLPSQIASWEAEATIREIVSRGKPWYEIAAGTMTSAERKKWSRGETGAGIDVAQLGGIRMQDGMKLPDALITWLQINRQGHATSSGITPYSAGRIAEGIQFASEVNAIEGNSGLVAGMAARRHVEHWEQGIRALIWTGAKYDDMPMRLRIDGELWALGQNPDDVSPSDLLDPHAEPTVREDDLRYTPMVEQMMRWRTVLQDVVPLASVFPNAVVEAMRRYLRAAGELDVETWLQPPPPQPAPPQMEGMPPGMEGMPPEAMGMPPGMEGMPPDMPPETGVPPPY